MIRLEKSLGRSMHKLGIHMGSHHLLVLKNIFLE